MDEERSLRTIEDWAKDKQVPEWLLAAMKAGNRWAEGKEVTAEDFDDAADRARGLTIGGPSEPPAPPEGE